MAVSLEEQVDCVVREIGMRRRVYARRVEGGSMTQKKADAEIAAMEAVLDTVRGAAEKGRLI